MLTSRNAISLTITLAVISLAWTCWSLMRPPDGDGMRPDSYGTRGRGQRAVLDTFGELGLPIRRSLGPPTSTKLGNARLVLWQPSSEIVRVEQKWLAGVGDWVRDGGHVLVAIGVDELHWFDPAVMREAQRLSRKNKKKKKATDDIEAEPRSLWELLQVAMTSISGPRCRWVQAMRTAWVCSPTWVGTTATWLWPSPFSVPRASRRSGTTPAWRAAQCPPPGCLSTLAAMTATRCPLRTSAGATAGPGSTTARRRSGTRLSTAAASMSPKGSSCCHSWRPLGAPQPFRLAVAGLS